MILRCECARVQCALFIARVKVVRHIEEDLGCGKGGELVGKAVIVPQALKREDKGALIGTTEVVPFHNSVGITLYREPVKSCSSLSTRTFSFGAGTGFARTARKPAAPRFVGFEAWAPQLARSEDLPHAHLRLPGLVHQHRPGLSVGVVTIAAPHPLVRCKHQSSFDRIAMHVAQFLDPLLL